MPTSDVSGSIVVTHSGRTTAISRDRVYFAFGDGRLAYDCVTCGAQCCRHHDFEALVDPELQRHLAGRHALRFFLDPCDAGADNHLSSCPVVIMVSRPCFTPFVLISRSATFLTTADLPRTTSTSRQLS